MFINAVYQVIVDLDTTNCNAFQIQGCLFLHTSYLCQVGNVLGTFFACLFVSFDDYTKTNEGILMIFMWIVPE